MASNKTSSNTELVDIYNRVSPTELAKIIKKNMEIILDNPSMSKDIPPILIRSSPGMGKSQIIKSVADELGIEFIDVRLAEMESCDIRGLPVPNREKKTMEWFVNGTWPTGDTAGIIFLDELTSCARDIQVASYELILDRKLGSLYKVPDKWMIVAAGNLKTDMAIATTMSSALANRMLHFQLESNSEDWTLWAQHHDVHPSVIGFINFQPGSLHRMEGENLEMGWPSPRSWEKVSTMLKKYGREFDSTSGSDENSSIMRKIVYGLVGNSAGVDFMAFYRANKEFDNVLEYMLDPDKEIKVPSRADGKHALVSAMIYQLWRGKNTEDQKKRIDGFFRISMCLTPDFAAMAMQMAMTGRSKEDQNKCAETLFKHPRYKEWSAKYGTSIHKRIKI